MIIGGSGTWSFARGSTLWAVLSALLLMLPSAQGSTSEFEITFELRKGIELPAFLPAGLGGWQGLDVAAYGTVRDSEGLSSTLSFGGYVAGEFAGRKGEGSVGGELELAKQGMEWTIQSGHLSGSFQTALPTPLKADIDIPIVGKVKIDVSILLGGGFTADFGSGGTLIGGTLSLTAGARASARANVQLFITTVDVRVWGQLTATLMGGYDDGWFASLDLEGEIGATAGIGPWSASFSTTLNWHSGTRDESQSTSGDWTQTSPWVPIEYLPTPPQHSSGLTLADDNDLAESSPALASLTDESSLMVWRRSAPALSGGTNLVYSTFGNTGTVNPKPLAEEGGDQLAPSFATVGSGGVYLAYLHQPEISDPSSLHDILPERWIRLTRYDGTTWMSMDTSQVQPGAYGDISVAAGDLGQLLVAFDVDQDGDSRTGSDVRISYFTLSNGLPSQIFMLPDEGGASFDPTVVALSGNRQLIGFIRDNDGIASTRLDRDPYYVIVENGVASTSLPLLVDEVEQRDLEMRATSEGTGAGLVFIESAGIGGGEMVRYMEYDGHAWKPVVDVASPQFSPSVPDLCFLRDGSAVVTWSESGKPDGDIAAALRNPESAIWSAPVYIRDPGFQSTSVKSVPTPTGAELVWVSTAQSTAQAFSEGDIVMAERTREALRPPTIGSPLIPHSEGHENTDRGDSAHLPAWFLPLVSAWILAIMVATVVFLGPTWRRWKK